MCEPKSSGGGWKATVVLAIGAASVVAYLIDPTGKPTPKPAHAAPAVAHAGFPWGTAILVLAVAALAVAATLLVVRLRRRVPVPQVRAPQGARRALAERPVRALPAAPVKAQDFVDGKVDVR